MESEPRIAFAADTDGRWDFYEGDADIFSMLPDGSDVRNLTSHPANDYSPEWSPDGTKLLFRTDRDGNHEIYLMNADGSSEKNLTRSPSEERSPAWSPDGTEIAFSSDRDGDRDIYVMNADGSDVRRLAVPGTDEYPTWSPDGRRIAFTSMCSTCTTFELWMMRRDGTGRRIVADVVNAGWPDWSPDGSLIAFDSPTDDGKSQGTFVVRPKRGSEPRFVGPGLQPDWSPDATRLAVFRGGPLHEGPVTELQEFEGEIHVIGLDGKTGSVLTDSPSTFEFEPTWHPLIPTPRGPPYLSSDPSVVRNRFATGEPLFDYEAGLPLELREASRETVDGVTLVRATFASLLGGRVPIIIAEPSGSAARPAMILQHGLPGRAEDMVDRMLGFATAGAVAVAIDAPYGRPGNLDRGAGPITFTPLDRFEQIQLIVDLRRVVDLLRARDDVDADRIGYLGISYGAAMGSLFAGVEPRIAAFALVVGDGGLVSHFTGQGAQTIELSSLPGQQRRSWIAAMEPIEPIYFIGAARAPLLLQSALHDEAVTRPDALAWRRAAGKEEVQKEWYDSGHILGDDAECRQARFLDRYLGFPYGRSHLCA